MVNQNSALTDSALTTQAVIDNRPWEKLPAESAKAYSAFNAYKNLHPKDRSLRQAVRSYYGEDSKTKVCQFSKWSMRFMWVDRASAWDEFLIREENDSKLKAIKDMNEREQKIATMLMSIALERVKKIEPLELSPREAINMIELAIRTERTAMGEATEITKQTGTDIDSAVTLIEMSDAELRQKLINIRLQKSTTK